MAQLHYGADISFDLDAAATRQVIDAIGAHATRGGWVSLTDVHGDEWTILVTAGIPIWVAPDAK